MRQPTLVLEHEKIRDADDIVIHGAEGDETVWISTAKTKKTAYKRAAAKLRKLADEAERLAEEE